MLKYEPYRFPWSEDTRTKTKEKVSPKREATGKVPTHIGRTSHNKLIWEYSYFLFS
jgi:hypothetical protein